MTPAPIAQLRDGTEVAAWMFKANPAVWDVVEALRLHHESSGDRRIESWRMAHSYRVDLVHTGQPCVLWVTGGRRSPHAGVWAIGHVSSEPYLDVVDPLDSLWVDRTTQDRVRPYVGVELDVFEGPILLSELLHDQRFSGAEIRRAPRVASPVALTSQEMSAILELTR